MFKNSIWWPGDQKRAALIVTIPFLIIIRQSELFGLMDSTMLVFGWLPIQLAFDALVILIAFVVAIAFYRAVPDPDIEDMETVQDRELETLGGDR